MTLPSLDKIKDVVGEEQFKEWEHEAILVSRLKHGHDALYYHACEWSFIQKRYSDYISFYIGAMGVDE